MVKTSNNTKPAILCLIDFSEASRQALEWAAGEAQKQETRLTVLYPYRLNQLKGKNDLATLRQGIDAEAVLNFQKIAKETLDSVNVAYEFKPEVGFINDRIFAHSHRKEFSMMVISKHMAATNRDSMMELIDLIKFPLVIVPQTKTEKHENNPGSY
jgi:hypothetical protein